MERSLTFFIQGSHPSPYEVTFTRTEEHLSATCTCNAGQLGKLCKHRLGLLKGESQNLASPNAQDIPRIHDLFKGSAGEALLRDLLDAEGILDQAKAEFTRAKVAFLEVVAASPD